MPSDLAGSQCCVHCRLQPAMCVCADVPRLDISTRLVVIIHSKEWRRSTNTGYLARLASQTGEVRLHGLAHRTVSSAGIDIGSPSTLALYPGFGAEPLTVERVADLPRPLTLLVPDGNWMQAKNMMRRVPMLSQARPVRLAGSAFDHNRLRRNICADRMSTFEAIAQALGILEGPAVEEQLLDFFRHVLGRMVQNHRRGSRQRFAATARSSENQQWPPEVGRCDP